MKIEYGYKQNRSGKVRNGFCIYNCITTSVKEDEVAMADGAATEGVVDDAVAVHNGVAGHGTWDSDGTCGKPSPFFSGNSPDDVGADVAHRYREL